MPGKTPWAGVKPEIRFLRALIICPAGDSGGAKKRDYQPLEELADGAKKTVVRTNPVAKNATLALPRTGGKGSGISCSS